MLAAITNPQPAATSGSNWQIVFVSLAVVILLLEVIHGWRLGLIRQLVRVIAIIVAYSCGFFAAGATVPLLRPHLKLPDPILAAVGGTILAFILFAAINLIGAFVFKKTGATTITGYPVDLGNYGCVSRDSPRSIHALADLYRNSDGWLGGTGAIAHTEPARRLRTPEWNCRPRCIGITTQPAHDNGGGYEELARTRSCRRGSARRRPASVRALSRVGESGRGGLESEYAERFLSFPGAREISEHPRVVALRNDRQVMQLIASGQIFELMKNQRMIDALNDPSLQTRIKKFDLERALDYALKKKYRSVIR